MSTTDQTNQRLSYTATWHVALVVDPIHRWYGAFAGPESDPIEGIVIVTEAEAQTAASPSYLAWQSSDPEAINESISPPHQERQRDEDAEVSSGEGEEQRGGKENAPPVTKPRDRKGSKGFPPWTYIRETGSGGIQACIGILEKLFSPSHPDDNR